MTDLRSLTRRATLADWLRAVLLLALYVAASTLDALTR